MEDSAPGLLMPRLPVAGTSYELFAGWLTGTALEVSGLHMVTSAIKVTIFYILIKKLGSSFSLLSTTDQFPNLAQSPPVVLVLLQLIVPLTIHQSSR